MTLSRMRFYEGMTEIPDNEEARVLAVYALEDIFNQLAELLDNLPVDGTNTGPEGIKGIQARCQDMIKFGKKLIEYSLPVKGEDNENQRIWHLFFHQDARNWPDMYHNILQLAYNENGEKIYRIGSNYGWLNERNMRSYLGRSDPEVLKRLEQKERVTI